MINSRQHFDRSVFALLAVVFCVLLSLRPIPNKHSANDTVRYVQELHLYCEGIVSDRIAKKESSYNLFFLVTSPACLAESDGLFLFEVALFLPLMFLLFAKWRNGTFLWACSLMFSVFGLELMTNAMRQGFAMLIFFGAVSLLERHRLLAFLLCLVAIFGHTSVLTFFPFFLWIGGVRLSKKTMLIGGLWLSLIGIFVFFAFYGQIIKLFQVVGALGARYSLIYADELKPSFILFMVLPLYWVYGMRHYCETACVTSEEKKGIVYSTVLLATSYLVFPYITFRVAIFAVVLQLFLVTRSERQGIKTAGYVFFGLLVHLFIMLIVSKHFAVLIYG
jgi:hypothetical protein